MNKIDVQVGVAALNANGDPDVIIVSMQATEEEIAAGVHYELAWERAEALGYKPQLPFDDTGTDPLWTALSPPNLMSGRELSTVLAALRYWQREGVGSGGHEQDIATDNGVRIALTRAEIDLLCERINVYATPSDLARVELVRGDEARDRG